MALTPEDVLNKTFTQTQFRRGYDEREVDDFLDEVVAEMRQLAQQNEELRGQLGDGRRASSMETVPDRSATTAVTDPGAGDEPATRETDHGAREEALREREVELTRAEADAQERIATVSARADEAERDAQARIQAAEQRASEAEQRAAEAEQRAEQRRAEAEQRRAEAEAQTQDAPQTHDAPAMAVAMAEHPSTGDVALARTDDVALAGAGVGGAGAASLIALAQRLHDEHVAEGESTRNRLIDEARARHDELLGEAQSRHEELLSTGQARYDELTSTGQTQHDEMLAEATARREEMLTEARERSTGMVAEAQQRKAAILQSLEVEKDGLEHRIDQLRGFEREYRSRLKDYIQGQLEELDQTAVDQPALEQQDHIEDEQQQG